MKPFALSVFCGVATLALVAAPAAHACFVCDNQQCRELTKETEQEIGFPNCTDGVDGNGNPFCFVSGFPCITPPGGFVSASAVDGPAMSVASTECAAPETPLAADDLTQQEPLRLIEPRSSE